MGWGSKEEVSEWSEGVCSLYRLCMSIIELFVVLRREGAPCGCSCDVGGWGGCFHGDCDQ